MTEKYAIGIDLGGTNVRAGLVNRRGKIVDYRMDKVGDVRTPKQMLKLMEKLVVPLKEKGGKRIIGIGCGFPGVVDVRTGIIGRAPHYPTWKQVPFRRMLAQKFKLPVVLDNDANLNAVGEMLWGAAKGLKNFIMITLGTGIGGGIVINGEVFHGDAGYAGEIGHIVIEREGVLCDCGNLGCWEEYAAAGFLKKHAGGGKLAEEIARAGDKKALELWREFGRNFAIGLNSLINVLGITTFVIGGGVARASDLFIKHVRAEIKSRAYPQNYKSLKLIKSKLIDSAGILGAAAAVFTENP